MKLIEIGKIYAGEATTLPEVRLTTDSAIVTNSRPVFPPPVSARWQLRIAPAYRINRLGKSIAAKFAPRYYDAMTLAARFLPLDLLEQVPQSPLATAFDGAVALGRWIPVAPVDELAATLTAIFPATRSGDPDIVTASALCPSSPSQTDEAIEFISRTFTLKTGDVIIPDGPAILLDVSLSRHLESTLNNQPVLTFNIK